MFLWLPRAAGYVVGLFDRWTLAGRRREPPSHLMIVPRGFGPNFYFFCEVFARERHAKLLLDRRVDERRRLPRDVPSERRQDDRRGHVPVTWREGSFVFVPNREPTPGKGPP